MKKNYLKTIPLILAECKRKFANKPALALINGRTISYNDMMWDISRTIQLLRSLGIDKSNKIALFTDNSPQTVETFLAVTRMGCAAIPLSYDYSEAQINKIFAAEKPSAVFIQKDKIKVLPKEYDVTILGMADNRVLSSVSKSACMSSSEIFESDIAAIVYTFDEDGSLIRHTLTQHEIVTAVTSAKKSNAQNAVLSLDSIFVYIRSYFTPLVNGICVYCHELLSSISKKSGGVAL